MKKFSGPAVQQFFIGSEPQRYVIAYLLLTGWQRYLMYQQHMTGILSIRLTIKADDGSRSYEVKYMNCSSRWLNGPSFLHLQKSDLPSQDILKARNSNVLIFHALQTNMHSVNKCPIDIARFSNWNCVVRVAAYCFFFLDRLKKQSNCSSLAHHTDWLTSTPSALHKVKTSETRFSLKKARRYCRQASKDALSFFNGRKEFRAKTQSLSSLSEILM